MPWTDLRFGSLPPASVAPDPPTAGQAVVDVARGHVDLGDDLLAAGPVRATWHRASPGSLGSLAADVDTDPTVPVVVTVNPALVTGGGRRLDLGAGHMWIGGLEALAPGEFDYGDQEGVPPLPGTGVPASLGQLWGMTIKDGLERGLPIHWNATSGNVVLGTVEVGPPRGKPATGPRSRSPWATRQGLVPRQPR